MDVLTLIAVGGSFATGAALFGAGWAAGKVKDAHRWHSTGYDQGAEFVVRRMIEGWAFCIRKGKIVAITPNGDMYNVANAREVTQVVQGAAQPQNRNETPTDNSGRA